MYMSRNVMRAINAERRRKFVAEYEREKHIWEINIKIDIKNGV
jgi:hypothetical protein